MPIIQEQLLDIIQASCKIAADHHQDTVSIDETTIHALASLLAPIAPTDVRTSAAYARPPIRFDDLKEEVDYIALSCLLDFGSGYNDLIRHTPTIVRSSAQEASEFAVLGFAMSGFLPDAMTMANMTRWEVSAAFNIDASEEKEVMPGVTMTSPGQLSPFLKSMQTVINETGKALVEHNFSSLGACILDIVGSSSTNRSTSKSTTMAPPPVPSVPSASHFVQSLISILPNAFRDEMQIQDTTDNNVQVVQFHRKAQQLALKLYLRFAKQHPSLFAWEDVDNITGESSAEVVNVLLARGVLVVGDEALAQTLEAGGDVGASDVDDRDRGWVAVLRAASVEAQYRICRAAAASGEGTAFTQWQLAGWLLSNVDASEEMEAKRLVCTETTAF